MTPKHLIPPIGMVILTVLLIQCKKTDLDIKTDENYVYNAILNLAEQQGTGLYVIVDSTAVYASLDSIVLDVITRASGVRLPESLIDDFTRQNNTNYRMSGIFDTLLEAKYLSQVQKDGGDAPPVYTLHEEFPNLKGVYTFSRAGFNGTKDMALVYAGVFRRGFEGEGHYYILKKENDVWQVLEKVELWSSQAAS